MSLGASVKYQSNSDCNFGQISGPTIAFQSTSGQLEKLISTMTSKSGATEGGKMPTQPSSGSNMVLDVLNTHGDTLQQMALLAYLTKGEEAKPFLQGITAVKVSVLIRYFCIFMLPLGSIAFSQPNISKFMGKNLIFRYANQFTNIFQKQRQLMPHEMKQFRTLPDLLKIIQERDQQKFKTKSKKKLSCSS